MPDALPVHLVEVDGFWMDRDAGHQRRLPAVRRGDRLRHRGRASARRQRFSRRSERHARAGFGGFHADVAACSARQSAALVALHAEARAGSIPRVQAASIRDREDHPVVHVAFEDAVRVREVGRQAAADRGRIRVRRARRSRSESLSVGQRAEAGKRAGANIWQGTFPAKDRGEDGYEGTSPVTAFPSNGFGLHDMGGNVWQWCADWYRPDYYAALAAAGQVARNPQGPADSLDPQEPGAAKRVLKGGSYLCTDQYCARYLVGSRGKAEVSSGASNLGFRLVRSGGGIDRSGAAGARAAGTPP